jgi:hypothetical protein
VREANIGWGTSLDSVPDDWPASAGMVGSAMASRRWASGVDP